MYAILCLAVTISVCHAQNSRKNLNDFNNFRQDLFQDFGNFRKEIIKEYCDFIRNPWKEFNSIAPVPKPEIKPVIPTIAPRDDSLSQHSNPIIIDDILNLKPIQPQPVPLEPIPEIKHNGDEVYQILFFNTRCKVRYNKEKCFKVVSLSEDNIADALTILSSSCHDNTIIDCLAIRKELDLCDWAYIQFLQTVADTICGKETNEATLLMSYIYMISGYKMRLAHDDHSLYMLFASKHSIWSMSSFYVDGETYYGVTQLPDQLKICQGSFPKEQQLSLQIAKQPKFSKDMSIPRTIASVRNPSFQFTVGVNKNLLSFYNTYPSSYFDGDFMTSWSQYADTPMSKEIADSLYPMLKKELFGKTELESVNMILNWVQTGFVYGYDDEIWGHDRTFFSEETLYYPYCDCEDRSVLFTRIVRDVLGLKCVLVYYPGHLASAVHFNSEVNGDYLMLNKQRYVICDPTYFGASVGMTMRGMENSSAKVILLK